MQQPRRSTKAVSGIVVAVLWIPLLIASIWIVNLVVWPPIILFTVLGISLPILASTYCQRKCLSGRGETVGETESLFTDVGTRWLVYSIQTTRLLIIFAAIVYVIVFTLNQPCWIVAYTAIVIGYLAVALNLLCSLVIFIRRNVNKYKTPSNDRRQSAPLFAWSALLFSIDALALTAFFTFVMRQLLLM